MTITINTETAKLLIAMASAEIREKDLRSPCFTPEIDADICQLLIRQIQRAQQIDCGCDRCGTNDRAPGLRFCQPCIDYVVNQFSKAKETA